MTAASAGARVPILAEEISAWPEYSSWGHELHKDDAVARAPVPGPAIWGKQGSASHTSESPRDPSAAPACSASTITGGISGVEGGQRIILPEAAASGRAERLEE